MIAHSSMFLEYVSIKKVANPGPIQSLVQGLLPGLRALVEVGVT